MYNRYIPQSDGSFQRSRVNDQKKKPAQQQKVTEAPSPSKPEPRPSMSIPSKMDISAGNFLKQLLPKDFDTGDLLIVLLLLLMAGDGKEEKSNALLTLVLYFFM